MTILLPSWDKISAGDSLTMSLMSNSIPPQTYTGPQTLLGLALLPLLIYYGNPAVGLLAGACLSLVFNKPVLNQASATIAGYNKGDVLSRDAQAALRDISKAADAMASLARMLERNPSALIRGR